MIAFPKLLLLRTGVFFLVWALLMLFTPKHIVNIVDKRVKNAELSFLFGLIMFILGFLYLLVYVTIDGSRYTIFSIMGYLCLLKGITMMAFPKFTLNTSKIFYGMASMTRVMGIILLVLTVFVFWATLVKF